MGETDKVVMELIFKGGAFLILSLVLVRQLMQMPKAIMITVLVLFGTAMIVITLLMIYQYDMMEALAEGMGLGGRR